MVSNFHSLVELLSYNDISVIAHPTMFSFKKMIPQDMRRLSKPIHKQLLWSMPIK